MTDHWRIAAISAVFAFGADVAICADEPLPTIPVDGGTEGPPSEPTMLEDIVVTATKREQLEREIPGSVGAVRGDDLENERAQGMKDFLKAIPGVIYNDQGTDSSVPVIRGIATETGFGSAAQTTGVYLDDMPFADLLVPLSLPDVSPFDLERVEVLKGPQGTLFGSGALAGAIRYVTRKPTPGLWEAKFDEVGTRSDEGKGDQAVAGAVNVPLLREEIALRAVGTQRRRGGKYDMSAHDSSGTTLRSDVDADKSDQWMGRGLITWKPSEHLRLGGLVFKQDADFDDVALADQGGSFQSTRTPFASPRKFDISGANLEATVELNSMQLLSSTSYLRKHNRILTHAEWFFDIQDQNQNQWYDLAVGDVTGLTQEIRLTSARGEHVSWLAGASYLRYSAEYFQYEPEPGPAGAPPPDDRSQLDANQRAGSFLFATVDSVATEEAAFGEVTFPISSKLDLIGGARLYETVLEADTDISGAQAVALTQQSENKGHFDPRARGFNPKLALRYFHGEHISFYGAASKGFQFGGVQVNPSAPALTQSAEQAGFHFGPYKSSVLWSYEAGIRTEWLNRRLRLDLSGFYLDWRDLQLTVRVPISNTAATFGVIANVGRAHSAGAEGSLDVLLFDGCRWTSSATWIDARTDVDFDEDNALGPVRAGTRLPGTPRLQWSNAVSYEHSIWLAPTWVAGLQLVHVHAGSAPDAIRETGTTGGYDTLDVAVTFKVPMHLHPELFLAGRNLTDAHAVTYHSRLTSVSNKSTDFYHFLDPRSVLFGVRLQY